MNSLIDALRLQWTEFSERDRRLVALAGASLLLLLLWLIAIRPAWQTWRVVPAQAAELEQQWLQMQRLASEARELKGQTPIGTAQAAQALKAATDTLGSHGKLLLAGDRATLTLNAATPEQMRAWLAEARQGARARPLELQLTRDDDGLSGRIVMALPGANP